MSCFVDVLFEHAVVIDSFDEEKFLHQWIITLSLEQLALMTYCPPIWVMTFMVAQTIQKTPHAEMGVKSLSASSPKGFQRWCCPIQFSSPFSTIKLVLKAMLSGMKMPPQARRAIFPSWYALIHSKTLVFSQMTSPCSKLSSWLGN